MLLGAPAAIAAPAADPVPVSVAAAEKSSSATTVADEATQVEIAVQPEPVEYVQADPTQALTDQAVRAARTPRAPPAW